MLKVLFSRNTINKGFKAFIPYEKDKKIFADVYPFVYEVVKILKTKKHSLLAIFLQRLESYIFIDCIAKELVSAGIVPLTIHDSVIVKAIDKAKALEIMNKVFIENFGVIPTFDIKNMKHKEQPKNKTN